MAPICTFVKTEFIGSSSKIVQNQTVQKNVERANFELGFRFVKPMGPDRLTGPQNGAGLLGPFPEGIRNANSGKELKLPFGFVGC